MKLSKSLLLIPAASFIAAVAVGSGACSSSVSVTGTEFPSTFTFPSGYETSCTSDTTYISISDSTLCSSGPTYLLCDGSGFTTFDCDIPDGYTEITNDGVSGGDAGPTSDASSPGDDAGDASSPTDDASSDSGSPPDDGGSADAGSPTDDGGSAPDGGKADAS
jgi:hypothetical protein